MESTVRKIEGMGKIKAGTGDARGSLELLASYRGLLEATQRFATGVKAKERLSTRGSCSCLRLGPGNRREIWAGNGLQAQPGSCVSSGLPHRVLQPWLWDTIQDPFGEPPYSLALCISQHPASASVGQLPTSLQAHAGR